MRRNSRGFTLLELVVVIAIFAIFAAMAYGGLESVLRTRAKVEASLTRSEEYQKAYLRLRGDFENAANRPVRDTTGEPLPAFAFDTYNKRVELTRGGWVNLLSQPRATLERVAWSLDEPPPEKNAIRKVNTDKRLVRRGWRVLDRAPNTEAVQTVILDHVDEIGWRFLDSQNQWQTTWPPQGQLQPTGAVTPGTLPAGPAPPAAVELRVVTKDWGELKFLFRLGTEGTAGNVAQLPPPAPPGGPPPPPPPPPPADNDK